MYSAWPTINTAPKDGTEIIGVEWQHEEGYAPTCQAATTRFDRGAWRYVSGCKWNPTLDADATQGARMKDEWRCFHCDRVFTDAEHASLHFGPSEYSTPACQVDAAKLRALESELDAYRQDDTMLHRYVYGLQSEHQTKLRQAEEDGYTKGLAAVKPTLEKRNAAIAVLRKHGFLLVTHVAVMEALEAAYQN